MVKCLPQQVSSDSFYVLTGYKLTFIQAADESLKFWKIFEKKPGSASATSREGGVTGKGGDMVKQMTIR